MFWKVLRNNHCPASCIIWNICSENFWQIAWKPSTTEWILKAHNYAKYELRCWCFSGNFQKIFRTAILKENLSKDAPYFVKEQFWMSASDEATLKFPMWERQTFSLRNFLSQKDFIFFLSTVLIYYNCSHWGT